MTRTGHRRARRDHRTSALAAMVMLLLALGASLLVSAGSEHHQPDTHTVATETPDADHGETTVAQPASDEHHHGNDWTPTLGKRLRPAATVTLLGILPAQSADVGPALLLRRVATPPDTGDALTSLQVLRV